MVKTPGFCRHVEKEWLEQSLRWVANGASSAQLNNSLDNFLSGYIVSKENRRKARNLLTSVWTQPVDQYIKNFFDPEAAAPPKYKHQYPCKHTENHQQHD